MSCIKVRQRKVTHISYFCDATDYNIAAAIQATLFSFPSTNACTLDRNRDHLLRSGLSPRQHLLVGRIKDERVIQHVAQEVWLAAQAAVHLHQGQRDSQPR